MRCVTHTGYLTHGNSMVKEKEEADTIIMIEGKGHGYYKGEALKQDITGTKDLTIMLLQGHDYPLP